MNPTKQTVNDKTNVFHFGTAGLAGDTGIATRPAASDWSRIKPLEIQQPRPKAVHKDVAVWVLC